MNFTLDTSKTQQANATSGDTAATGALPTFSIGGAGAGDAGKGMTTGSSTMATTMQNKPGAVFGPGLSTAPAQNTGLSFGTPSTTPGLTRNTFGTPVAATQSSGLTFGAATTPNTGISFGTANTAPSTGFLATTATGGTPGFTLGTSVAATTTPATSLTFGTSKRATSTAFSLAGGETTTPAAGTGLTFGSSNAMTMGPGFSLGSTLTATTASTTTTTATGFGLGGSATSTTAPGISADTAKTSTVQTGFSLAPTTAPLQSDSGFGTSTANTTATTGFSLGGTTSTATGFPFGAGTTATTTTGFSLNKTVSGAAPSSLAAPTTQISLGTTTTVSSSASGSQPVAVNFYQLEESINKWTLELEEQEKVFVNQASQINAWDKLLITNGEKIVTLNQEVERVKIEQQQLEHELDYVVGQQKELQDCLAPLEKELASLSVSDTEREYTYRLAENLDTQLKQMSEDLKEIIEHLNEANRTQDSSDPIVQIGKILNAHMNSLQWLDEQTTLLSQKIQQIDQMHQNFRQENERSFSLAYN